jgi:hypothetical protein
MKDLKLKTALYQTPSGEALIVKDKKDAGKGAKKTLEITSLAQCADFLFITKQKRSKIQAQADILEEQEKAVREFIINNLPASEATGIAGKKARVTIEKKNVPTAKDWPKLYAYIKKTGAFDLLQRRLANDAIKARWEEGKQVPGVDVFTTKTLSINAIKGGK